MLKEIYEQPSAIGNTVLGRLSLDTNTSTSKTPDLPTISGEVSNRFAFWPAAPAGTRRLPENT
jgi:hypothetical protein